MTPSSGSAGQEWRDDSPEGDLPLPHLFLPRQSITSTVIVAAVEDTSVGYRVLDKLAAHLYPSVGQYCQNDNTCSVGGQSDKKTRTVATESLEVISENVMNDDFSPSAVRIKKLILSHMDTSSGSDACQHYMCSGCEFLITSMLKDFEGRYSQTSGGASTAPLLIELFRQHLWASVSTASLKEVTQSLLYGNNDFSYHLFKASTLPRYVHSHTVFIRHQEVLHTTGTVLIGYWTCWTTRLRMALCGLTMSLNSLICLTYIPTFLLILLYMTKNII